MSTPIAVSAQKRPPLGPPLISADVSLYVFNLEASRFELVEASSDLYIFRDYTGFVPKKAPGSKKESVPYQFNMVASAADGSPLVLQRLSSDMQLTFLDPHLSIVWIARLATSALTMNVSFKSQPSYAAFRREVSIRLFETNRQMDWGKCEDQEAVETMFHSTPSSATSYPAEPTTSSQPPSPTPSSSTTVFLPPPPPPLPLERDKRVQKGTSSFDEDEFDFATVDEAFEQTDIPLSQRLRVREKNRRLRARLNAMDMAKEISTDDEDEGELLERDDEEESEESDVETQIKAPLKKFSLRSKEKSGRSELERIADEYKILVAGKNIPRSFAVRRSGRIDAISHDPTGRGGHLGTSVGIAKGLDGQSFVPRAAMLHHSNKQMLLLGSGLNRNKIGLMDLERGQVVQEWVSDSHGTPIDSIAPTTKMASTQNVPTFLGLNKNAFFLMDTRLSSKKAAPATTPIRVEGAGYTYAPSTRAVLTHATTTESGQVAVGSASGIVRLYDNSLAKQAKTQFVLSGDGVVGMDVSKDGRWILVTTLTYLLLIDTALSTSNPFSPTLAFDRTMPKAERPEKTRIRLELSPVDVMRLGGSVAFTPARFNLDPASVEKTIITTTGPFVITWNLAKIKAGKVGIGEYKIKRLKDSIVDGDFAGLGEPRNLVLAMRGSVDVESLTRARF